MPRSQTTPVQKGPTVMNTLSDALKPKPNAVCVDLGGQGIGDEGAKQIANVLNSWPTSLVELRLHANEITDIGIKALAEALKRPSPLMIVVVSNNHVMEQGYEALKEVMQVNQSIDAIYTNLRSRPPSQAQNAIDLVRGHEENVEPAPNTSWID